MVRQPGRAWAEELSDESTREEREAPAHSIEALIMHGNSMAPNLLVSVKSIFNAAAVHT